MALVIPKSVGGTADVQQPAQNVQPVEVRAQSLVIPESVGGATPAQQSLQQPAQAQPPGTGFGDIFTGAERIAATPELGTLPEFGVTPEAGRIPNLEEIIQGDFSEVEKGLKIAAGFLSTFDPKAQQDIILSQVPEAVFETTPDGSTIIEVPTEDGGTRRSVLNRPGFSPQDLTTATAQALSFIPAARIASFGKSVLQKVGFGAAAAGTTEQALQEVGVALGREERDPLSTGIAAVTGGLAEAVVPAVQSFRAGREAARVGASRDQLSQLAGNVSAARAASEATGIPLFQAQQTAIPAQLEKQAFVAQLPSGTLAAVKGLTAQNKAAGDAVETFIGQIAPDAAVVTGAEKVRTAAQTAIAATKRARSEASSPIYKQAFRRQRKGQLDLIDTSALETKVFQMSRQFDPKGQISKNLSSALDKLQSADGNLQKLHLAKTELDQTINTFGADSVGNTTKRFLTDVKNDLTDALVDQSPSYRAARDEFIRLTPEVTKIQDSIVGKIANLDDIQLKQVSTKLFDAGETNPAVLAQAKRAITDVNPSAWDEIIRVEFEKRLGAVKSIAEPGTVENLPGQLFRALFPNDKSTKVLIGALDDEGKKNLKYLRTALSRASIGRAPGSPTAGREEIKRELRGGIFNAFRNMFRKPIDTLVSTGEDAQFNRAVTNMSKALFDPTWKAEMKALRRFSPKSPEAGRALTQLINDIEATEPAQEEQ